MKGREAPSPLLAQKCVPAIGGGGRREGERERERGDRKGGNGGEVRCDTARNELGECESYQYRVRERLRDPHSHPLSPFPTLHLCPSPFPFSPSPPPFAGSPLTSRPSGRRTQSTSARRSSSPTASPSGRSRIRSSRPGAKRQRRSTRRTASRKSSPSSPKSQSTPRKGAGSRGGGSAACEVRRGAAPPRESGSGARAPRPRPRARASAARKYRFSIRVQCSMLRPACAPWSHLGGA
jgi:hypothetical protein